VLVVGTKQSREAWNRLGSPDCCLGLLSFLCAHY